MGREIEIGGVWTTSTPASNKPSIEALRPIPNLLIPEVNQFQEEDH